MASARNYWSVAELLEDFRYWSTQQGHNNFMRATASWQFLRKKWAVPRRMDIDQFAQYQIEENKFIRSNHTR